MRITIVGGCFPVQHNILPEELYHYTLSTLLAPHLGDTRPVLDIVRYERFGNCLAKVEAAHARQPAQVLLFHVRAEPVMRLAKLYYRYRDGRHRLRHSLTLPWQSLANPEQYDLPISPRPAAALAAPESRAHRALRQFNLRLGVWVGNRRRALHLYETLVADLAGFCHREGIRLLLVGPVSRPCAPEENRLSWELDAYFADFATRSNLEYVPALGETDAAGQSLFFADGVYVSAAGHQRIAELIFQAFK